MNTPANSSPRRPSGFTLIELLIVITIIAILASIAFPVTGAVMRKARETQAKADISALVTAVKGYYLEYGRYPVMSTDQGTDQLMQTTDSTNGMLQALLGYHDAAKVPNPRKIQFLDPKITSSGRGGYIPSGNNDGTGTYVDPWSLPYQFAIDSDYDNDLTAPAVGATTSTTIRKGILIYSSGIDKTMNTVDDIMSWK